MDAETRRRRITRIAAVNGWSMAVLAGLCLACSLLWFSLAGILIGAAAMASGCMELSGRRRLKQERPDAGRWLAGSQLLLLAAIILYAAYNLLTIDPKSIHVALQNITADLTPEQSTLLSQVMDPEKLEQDMVHGLRLLYIALIGGAVLYQGGLCLYYTLATRKLGARR